MSRFTAGEHAFTLAINVAAMKRVRAALGFDLAQAMNPLGFSALLADLPQFVDVLYVLVREQCQAADLTDEQFGELMAGEALHGAITAFEDQIVSFCPSPTQRRVYEAWRDRARERLDEAATQATSPEAMAALDQTLNDLLRRPQPPEAPPGPPPEAQPEGAADPRSSTPPPSGATSSNAPASSASTPPPSPGGSCA